jgi:hypothetical protein
MMFIFSSYFTPGVNFFIVLQAAFIRADSESEKRQTSHHCLFELSRSAHTKAEFKMLVKLSQFRLGTPSHSFQLSFIAQRWTVLQHMTETERLNS